MSNILSVFNIDNYLEKVVKDQYISLWNSKLLRAEFQLFEEFFKMVLFSGCQVLKTEELNPGH